MKKLFILMISGTTFVLFSFTSIAPATWTVDKMHAKIGFSITHNMTSDVEGSFKSFDAMISTTGDDFAGSAFDFTASAASITTDNEQRDKHIASADFLDVGKFPEVKFKSTSVIKKSVSSYEISGDLTLHGVTKRIVLEALVRMPPEAAGVTHAVAGFKISGVIKRSDFAIGGTFANLMLGDEIVITANGEFLKK